LPKTRRVQSPGCGQAENITLGAKQPRIAPFEAKKKISGETAAYAA
jgi:hypothetical protein